MASGRDIRVSRGAAVTTAVTRVQPNGESNYRQRGLQMRKSLGSTAPAPTTEIDIRNSIFCSLLSVWSMVMLWSMYQNKSLTWAMASEVSIVRSEETTGRKSLSKTHLHRGLKHRRVKLSKQLVTQSEHACLILNTGSNWWKERA